MCACACVCVCVCVVRERERESSVLISFLCSLRCLRQHATVSHYQSMSPKLLCNAWTVRRGEQSVNPNHVSLSVAIGSVTFLESLFTFRGHETREPASTGCDDDERSNLFKSAGQHGKLC